MRVIGPQNFHGLVPTTAIANDAVTGAKLNPSFVAGDVMYASGTDVIARLAKGSDGELLTLASGVPSWAAAAGGAGFTFISSTDLSDDATMNFTATDASSYDGYSVFLQNVIPATDNAHFWIRTSTDGGSGYDATADDYFFNLTRTQRTNTENDGADSATNATAMSFTGDTASGDAGIGSVAGEDGIGGWLHIVSPHLAKDTMIAWNLVFQNGHGEICGVFGGGARMSAADVDAFQFLFSSGNLESGSITVFGVANA